MKRILLLCCAVPMLVLAGCATAPKPLQGQFSTLTPLDGMRAEARGATVRWGGTIAQVEPQSGRTCFQVVGRSLTDSARPRSGDDSLGRFLACRPGFYDPEVFKAGREITVVGQVDGSEVRKIGEYDYDQPRVAADVIYLWPVRVDVDYRYADPWYGPWGPYWGPYYRPYWHPWYPWGPW